MSYIGKQPRKAALTASDIEDGIITAAKIEDGAVVAAEIASNAVTTAKINADAVTAAKIADNAISEEHLDATVITGLTALEAEPADTDEFLVSDAGTLKRIDYSHIKGGVEDGAITKAKLADQVDVFSGTSLSAADLGAGVHIKTADTSSSVSTNADELVVEGTRSGMTFLAANDNYSYINFGDSGATDIGSIRYGHPNNDLKFVTNSADQWTLDSSGNWLPAATDHGIYLGTTSAAAGNLLHDYEEGTWTPVMTTSGGSLSGVSYGSYNKGWYTKIGRNVTINFNVQLSSKGSGGSGAVRMSGHPFSSTTLLTASVYGSLYMYNGGVDQPCCTYGTFQNYLTLRYVDNASGGEIGYSDIQNNSSWSGMMTYITNQ